MTNMTIEQVVEWAIKCNLQDEFGVSEFAYLDNLLQFATFAYKSGILSGRVECVEFCEQWNSTPGKQLAQAIRSWEP